MRLRYKSLATKATAARGRNTRTVQQIRAQTKNAQNQSISQKELSKSTWWTKKETLNIHTAPTPSLLSSYANTPSGTYTLLSTMLSSSTTATLELIKYCQKTAIRPANIGAGTWAKEIAKDVAGTTKAIGVAEKVSTGLAVAGVALDVGIGVVQNIQNKASASKIVVDASVDVLVSGGTAAGAALVSSVVGATIAGSTVGSVVPGLGTVIGAGVGIAVAVGSYFYFDMPQSDGTTRRDKLKESANKFARETREGVSEWLQDTTSKEFA